eukprot:2205578-Pleurochrysis_carterae.AAC.1
MHEELLVRTRSSSCKYCIRSSSAVLFTADELVVPLCSRLGKIAPSRAVRTDRILVFTRARAVRQASVAGVWRRDGGERRTVA